MTTSPARRKALLIAAVALVVIAGAATAALLGSGHDAATEAELQRITQTAVELQNFPHERPPLPTGTLQDGAAADFYATAWEQFEPVHKRNDNIEEALDTAFAEVWLVEPGAVTTLAPACASLPDVAPAARPHLVGVHNDVCEALNEVQPTLNALFDGTRQRRNTSPFHPWNTWMYLGGGRSREASVFRELATLALIDARLRPVSTTIERTLALLRFAADLHAGGTVLGAITGASLRIRATGALRQLLDEPLTDDDLQQLLTGLAHVRRHTTTPGTPFETEYVVVMATYARWLGADLPVVPGGLPIPAEHLEDADIARFVVDRAPLWRSLIDVQSEPLLTRLAAYARIDDAIEAGDHELDALLVRYRWADYDLLITQSVAHVDLIALAAADRLYRRRTGAPAETIDLLRTVAPDLVTEDPLTSQPYGVQELDGERVIFSDAVRTEVYTRLGIGEVAASRLAIGGGGI